MQCCLAWRNRRQAGSHSVGSDTNPSGRGLVAAPNRSDEAICPGNQPLAAIAVTSTRMPSTASSDTPTAARTGHGLLKKR